MKNIILIHIASERIATLFTVSHSRCFSETFTRSTGNLIIIFAILISFIRFSLYFIIPTYLEKCTQFVWFLFWYSPIISPIMNPTNPPTMNIISFPFSVIHSLWYIIPTYLKKCTQLKYVTKRYGIIIGKTMPHAKVNIHKNPSNAILTVSIISFL